MQLLDKSRRHITELVDSNHQIKSQKKKTKEIWKRYQVLYLDPSMELHSVHGMHCKYIYTHTLMNMYASTKARKTRSGMQYRDLFGGLRQYPTWRGWVTVDHTRIHWNDEIEAWVYY